MRSLREDRESGDKSKQDQGLNTPTFSPEWRGRNENQTKWRRIWREEKPGVLWKQIDRITLVLSTGGIKWRLRNFFWIWQHGCHWWCWQNSEYSLHYLTQGTISHIYLISIKSPKLFLKKVVSEIARTNIKSYILQLKLILRKEIISQHIFSLFIF